MLVCWEWLAEYVDLKVEVDYLADRFAMTGLNHESTQQVAGHTVIDLEVTSNRGDCLGHIGVAREAAVILQQALRIPAAQPPSASTAQVAELIAVHNQFPEGCPRYMARIIRGVKVAPSPSWLQQRLAAVGIASVNNVVDVTNYVMLECGQPLHAFDLGHIRGGQIVIRPARAGETLEAIDHRTYQLDPQMVVIADAEGGVAIGGVMGGAGSEVSDATTDLLIEAAAFNPLAIRRAARLLKLQSPSSFRFERRPDPAGLDWASRRCCELILQLAGGQLCSGVVDTGPAPAARSAIELRSSQIERILGIQIPPAEVERILSALGCSVSSSASKNGAAPNAKAVWQVVPPTWRGDVSREADLIEEVARIYGYEQIPEDVSVPLQVAEIRPKDLAVTRMRQALCAYGIDEAMTASVVPANLEQLGSPWTDRPPLETETPLLIGAKLLRRSLLPSLLAARYANQTQAIRNAQLYEVANIFLPAAEATQLPQQMSALGIVTHGDLRFMRGVVEELIAQVVSPRTSVVWETSQHPLFAAGSMLLVKVEGQLLGVLGLLDRSAQSALSLDQACAIAELNVDLLAETLQEVRRADAFSQFPAISRDLNFVVDEAVRWADFEQVCRTSANALLQEVRYQETYRDASKDGPGKKRLLLSLHFQSIQRTLTSEEVDEQVAQIIAACGNQFAAKLLG